MVWRTEQLVHPAYDVFMQWHSDSKMVMHPVYEVFMSWLEVHWKLADDAAEKAIQEDWDFCESLGLDYFDEYPTTWEEDVDASNFYYEEAISLWRLNLRRQDLRRAPPNAKGTRRTGPPCEPKTATDQPTLPFQTQKKTGHD